MKGIHINTGQSFGRLTVIRELPRIQSGGQTIRQIEAKCECGNLTPCRPSVLKNGRKKSCGCLQKDKASNSGKLRRKAPGEAAINSVQNSYRNAAKKRGLTFELTRDQLVRLIFDKCRYCGAEPQNIMSRPQGMFGSITYNGIDRVDNSKGYAPENCVTACETCNIAKQKMGAETFVAWINRVYSHIQQHPL